MKTITDTHMQLIRGHLHVVEVHSAGKVTEAGRLVDDVVCQDERLAFEALPSVVSDGPYLLEDE